MTAFGAEEKALRDSVELVSNRSASFRQGSEGQLWVNRRRPVNSASWENWRDSGLIAPSIPISTRGSGVSRHALPTTPPSREAAPTASRRRPRDRNLRTAIHCHPVTCAPDGVLCRLLIDPIPWRHFTSGCQFHRFAPLVKPG